ncbi:AzlC family ABC transporter permease [Thermodesulfobacteriota bacterium]
MKSKNDKLKSTVIQGLLAAWPICLGYIPIGLAFGVLAQKAGLQPVEIGLMSIFVFAGSSQFIAVSMLSAGAATLSIVMTTFVVNLRHLLMSSALAIHLGRYERAQLTAFAYGVTDESFAINLARFNEGNWGLKRALVLNQTANITWIISTIAGGYGGQFIPEKAFGIDYALIAMFICLLTFQLRGRKYIITAVIAGVSAVGFSLLIPGNFYIVIASILAATVGVIFKRYL